MERTSPTRFATGFALIALASATALVPATLLAAHPPTPPPCAADGACYPKRTTWGYYKTNWRPWPGDKAGIQPTPAAIEDLPETTEESRRLRVARTSRRNERWPASYRNGRRPALRGRRRGSPARDGRGSRSHPCHRSAGHWPAAADWHPGATGRCPRQPDAADARRPRSHAGILRAGRRIRANRRRAARGGPSTSRITRRFLFGLSRCRKSTIRTSTATIRRRQCRPDYADWPRSESAAFGRCSPRAATRPLRPRPIWIQYNAPFRSLCIPRCIW